MGRILPTLLGRVLGNLFMISRVFFIYLLMLATHGWIYLNNYEHFPASFSSSPNRFCYTFSVSIFMQSHEMWHLACLFDRSASLRAAGPVFKYLAKELRKIDVHFLPLGAVSLCLFFLCALYELRAVGRQTNSPTMAW